MHISEGILSAPVLIAGFAGTAVLSGITLREMDMEEIPKISVVTAAFFVASLIHFPTPFPGVSIHLILNGLVGITLGLRCFPAIMIALVLQALLFGHGGVTVIGVNSIMLGGGGLIAYFIWQIRHAFPAGPKREPIFGGIAAAASVAFSGIILALALVTTGEGFATNAKLALSIHVPIMVIEGIVVSVCAGFLMKVKPDILAGHRQTGQRHAP